MKFLAVYSTSEKKLKVRLGRCKLFVGRLREPAFGVGDYTTVGSYQNKDGKEVSSRTLHGMAEKKLS